MKSLRSHLAAIALIGLSQLVGASPTPFAGSLSITDPTYNRLDQVLPAPTLSASGTAVSYDVFAFHVTESGNYIMRTLSAAFATGVADDTFITLYGGGFDPADPILNALGANDDGDMGFLSALTLSLSAGTNYYLVVTSIDNGQFGDYTGSIGSAPNGTEPGVGEVVFGELPEPSMLLLLPMALLGAAAARRRHQV